VLKLVPFLVSVQGGWMLTNRIDRAIVNGWMEFHVSKSFIYKKKQSLC
jgi:hypothetical protein